MRKVYKSMFSVAAAITVTAATLTPAIVNAWGDNSASGKGRPSYTIDEIESNALGNKIVFNSIKGTDFGDEKNFVGAKVAGSGNVYEPDTINVKDGGTYTIRLYAHNNNPRGEDAIAKDVKVRFESASLSSKDLYKSKSHTIVGYLSSSNATPNIYWDEIKLNATEDVYLEYVEGSAKFVNNKINKTLSDDAIVTGSDMLIGYEALDGNMPGCYGYSGVVTFDVKVHSAVAASLDKKVRVKGSTEWSESVEAKIGDEVEFRIIYQNLLSEKVTNVMIRDALPKNVEFVSGSAYLVNSNYKHYNLTDDVVTDKGVNIGDYGSKANAAVYLTGKVVDKTMECGKNKLVNWADVTVNGKLYNDDASIMVAKDGDSCKEPTPTPTPEPEPTPTPEPAKPSTPTNEPTPTTIVSTGAGTIVTGAVGAGSVVTMLGYYIASRKKLM